VHGAVGPAEQAHRHRVEHLVGHHHALDPRRQRVEPGHATEQRGHPPGQQLALPRAQRRGHLDDLVALGHLAECVQRREQFGGQRPGTRAELDDSRRHRPEPVRALGGHALAEQRRELGRRDEIALGAELAAA